MLQVVVTGIDQPNIQPNKVILRKLFVQFEYDM
jgi:hypothetical protein